VQAAAARPSTRLLALCGEVRQRPLRRRGPHGDVSIRRARVLADTLRDVQDRVRRALDAHALPSE
jgi:hypothetical protein